MEEVEEAEGGGGGGGCHAGLGQNDGLARRGKPRGQKQKGPVTAARESYGCRNAEITQDRLAFFYAF